MTVMNAPTTTKDARANTRGRCFGQSQRLLTNVSASTSSSSSSSSSSVNGRNLLVKDSDYTNGVDGRRRRRTYHLVKANITDDYDIVPKQSNKNQSKGFVGGMLIGGAVFGALGFLFAPQLSKQILRGKKVLDEVLDEVFDDEEGEEDNEEEDENGELVMKTRSMRTEKRAERELEDSRKTLNEKIAELNKAIDEFSIEADEKLSSRLEKLENEMEAI